MGLLPSADLEAVRVAFRKLAPVYHPDTSTLPKDVAEEKFVRLREAYEVRTRCASGHLSRLQLCT